MVASDETRSDSQTGARSIVLEILAGNQKAEGLQPRASAGSLDEIEKRRGERGLWRTSQDDGCLIHGRVERRIHHGEDEALARGQRSRHEAGFRRAALDELHGLLHVL